METPEGGLSVAAITKLLKLNTHVTRPIVAVECRPHSAALRLSTVSVSSLQILSASLMMFSWLSQSSLLLCQFSDGLQSTALQPLPSCAPLCLALTLPALAGDYLD